MSHSSWKTVAICIAAASVGITACATPQTPAADNGPTPAGGQTTTSEMTESSPPAHTEADSGHAVVSSAVTETAAIPTISASDRSMMADYGDTVKPISAQDDATRKLVHVTAQAAQETALHTHGFLSGSHVESVTLARLTDSKYGPQATTTDAASGTAQIEVVPIIKNRLVWLVIFSHFAMPAFGPGPDGTTARQPDNTTPNGRMWIAVDAVTGDALLGSSIQNGD